MTTRLANMLESTLSPPPAVDAFVAGLCSPSVQSSHDPTQDMFDGALDNVVKNVPQGSKKVQAAAIKLVSEFGRCGVAKNKNVDNLDEWFHLLAK